MLYPPHLLYLNPWIFALLIQDCLVSTWVIALNTLSYHHGVTFVDFWNVFGENTSIYWSHMVVPNLAKRWLILGIIRSWNGTIILTTTRHLSTSPTQCYFYMHSHQVHHAYRNHKMIGHLSISRLDSWSHSIVNIFWGFFIYSKAITTCSSHILVETHVWCYTMWPIWLLTFSSIVWQPLSWFNRPSAKGLGILLYFLFNGHI